MTERAPQKLSIEAIIPRRMVVSQQTGEWLLERLEHPQEPTEAMRQLYERVRAQRWLPTRAG